MAQYTHLPIYKTTYDLLNLVTKKIKTFPRDFKYSLGDKIREECINLVIFIYKANLAKEKKEFLDLIMEKIQVVQLLIRLSKDLHLINVKGFSEIVVLIDSISKQASGWKKCFN
jgi:hypothetical protein